MTANLKELRACSFLPQEEELRYRQDCFVSAPRLRPMGPKQVLGASADHVNETWHVGSNSTTKFILISSFIQPVPDYRRLGRRRCVWSSSTFTSRSFDTELHKISHGDFMMCFIFVSAGLCPACAAAGLLHTRRRWYIRAPRRVHIRLPQADALPLPCTPPAPSLRYRLRRTSPCVLAEHRASCA